MPSPQVASWCFTSYDCEYLLDPDLWPHAVYCIYQLEICPKTGRNHYQGYVHFERSLRRGSVSKLEGLEKAHLIACRGTAQENINYCSKSDSAVDGPYEWGDKRMIVQGARRDIILLKDLIDKGEDDKVIWDQFPSQYLRYYGGIARARLLMAPKRNTQTELHVVIGPTNLGKTTYVRDTSPNAYWKPMNDKWFDNYNGKSDIVLDDFYGNIQFSEMLHLVNLGPWQVECKQGYINFNPARIWITSNRRPDQWYKKDYAAMEPLFRRITSVMVFFAPQEFKKFSSWNSFTLDPLFNKFSINGLAPPANVNRKLYTGREDEEDLVNE